MEKQPAEKPVEKAAEKAAEAPKEAPKAEKPKKKKTGLIIGIIIALLAIAGGVVAAILLLNKGDTTANDETISNILADIAENKEMPDVEFKGKFDVAAEGVKANGNFNGKYAKEKMTLDLDGKVDFGSELPIKASLASDGTTLYVKLNSIPDISAITGDAASAAMVSMFIKEGTWYSVPAEMTTSMTGQFTMPSTTTKCGSIDMQKLIEISQSNKSWLIDTLRDSKFISLEADGDLYKVYVDREETSKLLETVSNKYSEATKCKASDFSLDGMAEKEEIPNLRLGFRNGKIAKVVYKDTEAGFNVELELSYPGNLNIEMPSDAQSLTTLMNGMFGSYGYDNDYDDDDDDDDDYDWYSWDDDDEDEDDDDEDFDVEGYINSLLKGDEAESLQNSLKEAEEALEGVDWDQLESLLNALK